MEKIEKIIIKKGDNKTISDNFIMGLKPYTVLVGENNSGKTNFVNAFYEQEKKKYNIIFFRATNIELEKAEEANTSKKTSPFYELLAEILKKENLNLAENIVKPINSKLSAITEKINEGIDFIKNKKIILKMVETLTEEAVIKNLIPLKILDKHWRNEKEVEPDQIGQGTQRMIIFSLLKYYSEQNEGNEKLNFFIIEEPEVYLHPKYKKEFNQILYKISEKENNQVLIATHDPYFIEMNANDESKKAIQALQRNENTGFTEGKKITKQILQEVSHGEINYRVFEVCTDSFHNELYGHLQEITQKYYEKDIEEFFGKNGLIKDMKWTREKAGEPDPDWTNYDVTLQTFIRNKIHHPENKAKKNEKFSSEDLKQSIEEMISFIERIKSGSIAV